ncbi:MAG TPA: hypothetical protein VF503_28105 [Sphingobium sp.]|uniref:hypothetical protein n=1 Tax=Sphingobium sp. TaxID=1912891 RepID=UPI002ED26B3B
MLLAAVAIAAAPAHAYIGDSFLNIPGKSGHWSGKDHKGWVRAQSNEWSGRLRRISSGNSDALAGNKLFFGGPNAPKPGNSGKLNLAISKKNPDLPRLMAICASKEAIAEMGFAESSERARPLLELGPRPAGMPEYWEYKLRNVQVVGCPVVDGAEDQALILAFKDIEWLNYDPDRPMMNKITVKPEDLPHAAPADPKSAKGIKSFLITWIAPATDTTDAQCPVMNSKPGPADVFRYMPKADADRIRAQNGEKGVTFGPQSEARGPDRLNVNLLPGIIPDPGLAEPKSMVVEGIDLDGDGGKSLHSNGGRKKNFVSPDGRPGIDNQLYPIMGCIAGFRGKNGYRNQTSNARRADGNVTTLIEISGIDDEKNDDEVEIAFIYARDKPIRDNVGSKFIPNYTFRPTDDPNFALYNFRVKGRIVNGVILSDMIPTFEANLGQDPLLRLFQAKLRFEPQPDGSVKGILGGYRDWRYLADSHASGYSEGLFGYQQPALYYALKRNADGLKNPVTGEYDGISVAYRIDTVPAFLTANMPGNPVQVAEDISSSRKSR